MSARTRPMACSFCSKPRKAVKNLVVNEQEDCFICSDCVQNCSQLLAELVAEKTVSLKKKKSIPSPKTIKEFLDQYVIGQDYAKEVIAVAVYNHYKRLENPVIDGVEIDKSNILMAGASGTGKTHIARSVARYLDVPIAICDATSLTEAGYVGEDVESVIARLLQVADGDVKKAERGIIFIDECDKKSKKESNHNSSGRDVAGEGVQQALLKLLEGTDIMVSLSNKRSPNSELVKINTKNILFILSGAFVGLDNILERDGNSIGFGASIEKKSKSIDMLKRLEPEHLIKFGLIPELVGRIPIIVMLDELDEEHLVRILTEPKNSLVKQYTKVFSLDGIELVFDEKALRAVAKIAKTRKTNGRALRSVIETRLLKTQFHLPDLKKQGVEKIIIHESTILDGSEPELVYNNANLLKELASG